MRYLDRRGLSVATSRYDEPDAVDAPMLDLTSGYVQRAAHLLPENRGAAAHAEVVQSYAYDLAVTRLGRIDDGHLGLR